MELPEGQPRIERRPRISGIAGHLQRLGGSAEDDQFSVDTETAQSRAHRISVRDGGEDDFGAAQLRQFGRGILRLAVDVRRGAEFFRQRLLILARARSRRF